MALSTAPVTRPFVATAPAGSVSATAAASSAVLVPGTGSILRIVNEGPSVVFFALGAGVQGLAATVPTALTAAGTAVATKTSNPVLPGADVSFTRDTTAETFISTICRAGGTATLTIQTGEGN